MRWDEYHRNILQESEILGYQFELRRDTKREQSMSIDEEEPSVRLRNLDW